ncbi:MAG TPA: hypothetical protein VFJ48_01310 [Casimicrobiaceae bacterium]|nr:hypothetical protein [Casimicrobiaceae bacterium]
MATLATKHDQSLERLGRFVKWALGWLALVLLGYFALAAVRHSTTPLNEATGIVFDGRTAAAVPQRDDPPTSPARVSASKAIDGVQEPRECDLSKGVTTACVFE